MWPLVTEVGLGIQKGWRRLSLSCTVLSRISLSWNKKTCRFPGRSHGWASPTAITHLERKKFWTKPPGNYVPAVNLQGCTCLLSSTLAVADLCLFCWEISDCSAHLRTSTFLQSNIFGNSEVKTRWALCLSWLSVYVYAKIKAVNPPSPWRALWKGRSFFRAYRCL